VRGRKQYGRNIGRIHDNDKNGRIMAPDNKGVNIAPQFWEDTRGESI